MDRWSRSRTAAPRRQSPPRGTATAHTRTQPATKPWGSSSTSPFSTARADARPSGGDPRRLDPVDPHLLQCFRNPGNYVVHLVGIDRADASDAERLDLRELSRIQDVAARAHVLVEGLEVVRGIRRRVERHDDRRLHRAWEEAP